MGRWPWIVGLWWLLSWALPVFAQTDEAREVWVEATLSEPNPYVGQQTTYRFALFQSVQVTDATFDPPDFEGFSAEEIKTRSSRRQTIDNREYVITEIYHVLVPLKPGSQTIQAATLRLGVVRPDPRRRRTPFDDFFDDPFIQRSRIEPVVLQSTALSVEIRPLPPWEGTAAFTGLVGQFELAAAIHNTEMKVGQSATLTITVQGRGNVMDAGPPQLPLPEGMKTYADAPEEEIQLTAEGYRGKKVFRTAIVPLQPGAFELPEVRLPFFDPLAGAYRHATAALPVLFVAPAENGPDSPMAEGLASAGSAPNNEVAFAGRDIPPPKEGSEALRSQRPLIWIIVLIGLLVPAAIFGTMALVQRARRKNRPPAVQMRDRARKALKAAGAHRTRDPAACLTALYQALIASIFARIGRTGEALTWNETETLLRAHDVAPETARQAAELLARIETHRFGGQLPWPNLCDQLLADTRAMIRKLT